MYKKQNRDKQKDIRVVSLEDLVPRDHLLRKIDRAIIAPQIIPDKNDFKMKKESAIKNNEK